MTNPTIYSGSERILKAGVFCTLLDLTLTLSGAVFYAGCFGIYSGGEPEDYQSGRRKMSHRQTVSSDAIWR